MRGVVQSRQTVCHAVDNAQANIGETHAGNVLTQSHALAPLRGVLHSAAQVLGDQLDGFQVEHIRDGAMALGDVAFNGMGQCVHTGGGGQTLGHAGHHIGVNHSDFRNIVGIHADELALLLYIGDDIIDGNFGSGTGGGGHGNGKHSVLFGGGNAFQAADIRKFGVVDDDADGLCSIHGGSAADGHDAVRLSCLESSNAVLHVLDGGVGLDFAVNSIGEAGCIQQGSDLAGNAELDQVGVRADKSLFIAAGGQFGNNVLDCTMAMVRDRIQNNAVSHNGITSVFCAWFALGHALYAARSMPLL